MQYLTPLSVVTDTTPHVINIPDDDTLRLALFDALAYVAFASSWLQVDDTHETAIETVQTLKRMIEDIKPMKWIVGTVIAYAGNPLPEQLLSCEGQSVSEDDYPLLAAILPVVAGEITLPDLRDRFILGAGNDYLEGDSGGEAEHTLSTDEMPSHTHTDAGHTHSEIIPVSVLINGGLEAPASAAIPSASVTGVGYASLSTEGASEPHNNMPPFYTMRYCIVARL